ncbi:MAG: FG-GAP-like repeat-containing protein [Gemmatimonadota bacterium]|nr:FG-GAP-like repeat-containing protein [Gemmatimonadota bacterium]
MKGGTPGFTSMESRSTGVTFQNSVSDSILLGNRILGQGAGVALGDVDGDGRPDIFLARTEGCSALYRNLGNWRFEDITKSAGVGACDRHSTGAAFADVDGDGDLDLILLATTGPNAIFLNDGHGKFVEHHDLGLDTTGRGGTTIAMADVTGDGPLSLFVANYKPYIVDDTIPPQQRAFNQMVKQTGPGKFEITPEHRRDYKLVMRPDMGGLRMTQRGERNDFYQNDGHGHFTRVSMLSNRFRDAQGARITEEPESFSLAAKFVDLNGDGAPDLYVANDFEDTDELWMNDGHGNFRLGGWTTQRQFSNSAMGVDVADVNGDGIPDIFEVDMLSNNAHRVKTEIPTHTALPKRPGDIESQLQLQRNSLFINRGDGTFGEAAMFAGVEASGWSWGTMFMDVDLDGWQDILVTTGHLWDIMDADVQEGLQNRLTDVPWRRLRWQFPKLPLRNVAFRNNGNLTFEDVSASWRFGLEEGISHGIAAADLDGDGDLDVVINRLGAPALLMRNDASAPRVSVRLSGPAPNTQAVGAKIELHGGAVPLQTREVVVGGLYMSHSDYTASFAMGHSDSATLVVVWRDGRRSTITGVRPNRAYEISASSAVRTATRDSAAAAASAPLFDDVSAQLGGHVHTENTFDDWERQFLLPDALSQLGPGVSWYDLDRDGHEDLIVGTGKGGKLGVFRNAFGALKAVKNAGPLASNDYTTVLGITQNNSTQLLIGVSTWEVRGEAEMVAQPSVQSVAVSHGVLAATGTATVGSHQSATGPMALADYDGDGTLDLFVGARVVPLRYPVPASSGLFRNVGGKFVFDTANAAVLHDVGLVSAATFADINGDGYDDLILAREWSSLLLLLNDGHGHFQAAPDSWGLAAWTSRFNGVATGDLDGDGRLDIVATSWGDNTEMKADSANPLVMVYGPIGARKEEEMLLGRFDTRVAGLSPYNSYARARMAIPALVTNANTFAAYADASIEKLLGASLSATQQLKARTLQHLVFMNRGGHFEVHALPVDAQMAPAFYAGIADFNGDGNEDLFISQNFFPTVIGSPRYDAGRSLLLLGDGKGGLTAMSGAKSGLVVYGDQRGAAYADFNGDGRLDLAVSQNGAATRLFQNRGAKPGLRVRVNGPPSNPDGIGTQLRIVYGTTMGPVREVQAGSGYWSQNGAIQVFGLSAIPTAIWVRWPGGAEVKVPVPAGAREVVVVRSLEGCVVARPHRRPADVQPKCNCFDG